MPRSLRVTQFTGAKLRNTHDEGVLAEVARNLRIAGAPEQDQADAARIAGNELGFRSPVAVFDALDHSWCLRFKDLNYLKHCLLTPQPDIHARLLVQCGKNAT
jgi:hypothetical protein